MEHVLDVGLAKRFGPVPSWDDALPRAGAQEQVIGAKSFRTRTVSLSTAGAWIGAAPAISTQPKPPATEAAAYGAKPSGIRAASNSSPSSPRKNERVSSMIPGRNPVHSKEPGLGERGTQNFAGLKVRFMGLHQAWR